MLKSSPAFSIGSGVRMSQSPMNSVAPGPASYTPESQQRFNSPSAVIGRARKPPLIAVEDTPGPGSYEVESRVRQGVRAAVVSRKGCENPHGPGEAETKSGETHLSSLKCGLSPKELRYSSFGVRSPSPQVATSPKASYLPQKCLPSRSSYTISSPVSTGPMFTFSRAERESRTDGVSPGPGSYETRGEDTTTLRNAAERVPGNCIPVRSKSPAYTIGKAKWKPSRQQTPSPADYNPIPPQRSSPSHKIGYSQRGLGCLTPCCRPENSFPSNRSCTPGRKMNRSLAVDKGRKSNREKGNTGPSPGDYEINRELIGPKYSFSRSQRPKEKAEEVPGPGQYSLPSGVANVPSYSDVRRY